MLGLVAGLPASGVSCSARDVVVDIPIVAYVPAGCGDAGSALVTYTALGDFPQATPAADSVMLGMPGFALTALPAATRQVLISPATLSGPWTGSALVPDAGAIEVLTLPLDQACPLSTDVNLAAEPGASIGMMDTTHAMLMGGVLPPFVIDLGTGAIKQLTATLTPPREYVTITPFGAGALIAGGEDATSGEAQDTATVYTPAGASPGAFGSPIVLPSGQRMQHGAARLSDGRVLLVGGISDTKNLVMAIDVLDPAKPTQPTTLAAQLHYGRVAPTVIALPNGEVFVGGGFDAQMKPVASAEWLAADLSSFQAQPLCGAAAEQGFAATEGGAVLAVMGTPATPGCSNVQLLLSAGAVDAPALASTPLRVRLFQGAQASPVLLTDTESGTAALRWNPWTGEFTALGQFAAGLSLPTPTVLAPTPGLALWLGEDDNIWTLRFDTHGEYATDVAHGPYLVTDDMFTAPGALPGADVAFSVASGVMVSNGATVWVTDATFAEVTASVVLPVGGSAIVVLRDPSGKEVTCTATDAPPAATVQVIRTGSTVMATVGDAGAVPCAGTLDATVRVAIGVRGPASGQGTTSLRSLSVQR